MTNAAFAVLTLQHVTRHTPRSLSSSQHDELMTTLRFLARLLASDP